MRACSPTVNSVCGLKYIQKYDAQYLNKITVFAIFSKTPYLLHSGAPNVYNFKRIKEYTDFHKRVKKDKRLVWWNSVHALKHKHRIHRYIAMKNPVLILIFFAGSLNLHAQLKSALFPRDTTSAPTGAWARLEVENGDSVFVMSLRPVRIWQPRKFKDLDEQVLYNRYKYAAKLVYPYALQAIGLYEELSDQTEDMSRRQRKRYIRHENRELKGDFEEQMKKLSKTQGKVLIKMIEKELHMPFYELIRQTRGGLTAAYWHNLGKLYGYDLKEGYIIGEDPLLDEIFLDYDFGDPTRWYR